MNRSLGTMALVAVLTGVGVFLLLQSSGLVAPNGGGAVSSQNRSDNSVRPDFALPDVDGEIHSISEWDGKIVLVNFWATWCPPCRREIPGFIELKKAYADQGFEIVGVAIDDADKVRAFIERVGINYPVLHGQGDANQVAEEYGDTMNSLPYSALIDREGKIRFSGAGGLTKASLEKALKSLL